MKALGKTSKKLLYCYSIATRFLLFLDRYTPPCLRGLRNALVEQWQELTYCLFLLCFLSGLKTECQMILMYFMSVAHLERLRSNVKYAEIRRSGAVSSLT